MRGLELRALLDVLLACSRAQRLDQPSRRGDPAVGLQERRLELLEERLVDAPASEELGHRRAEHLARARESRLEPGCPGERCYHGLVQFTRDKKSAKAGKIRIIAGEYRGRRIAVPDIAGLRPTPDRVRETLFNWLGQWLDGLACLDLFAGSGALGFEAASRGAARVVMVEQAPRAFAFLESNRDLLGARVELVQDDAFAYLKRASDRFDVVFLDPPFGQNSLAAALERLPRVLAPDARVYVEGPRAVAAPPGFRLLKQDRAGQVHYHLLQWRGDDQSGLPGNV